MINNIKYFLFLLLSLINLTFGQNKIVINNDTIIYSDKDIENYYKNNQIQDKDIFVKQNRFYINSILIDDMNNIIDYKHKYPIKGIVTFGLSNGEYCYGKLDYKSRQTKIWKYYNNSNNIIKEIEYIPFDDITYISQIIHYNNGRIIEKRLSDYRTFFYKYYYWIMLSILISFLLKIFFNWYLVQSENIIFSLNKNANNDSKYFFIVVQLFHNYRSYTTNKSKIYSILCNFVSSYFIASIASIIIGFLIY